LAVDTFIENVKSQAVAGAVFYKKFLEFACTFAAERAKEKPPNPNDLTCAADYLIGVSDSLGRTPLEAMVYASNAMLYGVSKAEAFLSGRTGPLFKLIIEASVRDQREMLGLSGESPRLEPLEAAKQFVDALTISVPYFPKDSISLLHEADGSISIKVSSCPATDVCKALKDEGVKRVVGDECQTISIIASWVKHSSEETVDWRIISKDLSGSSCRVRGKLILL
jgi:hypothetical protein